MREFSTNITGALVNGLRPDKNSAEADFFSDLYNLVSDDFGLSSYEPVLNVLPAHFTESADLLPQWFRFMKEDIAVTHMGLFQLDDNYLPFDASYLHVQDWDNTYLTEQFRAVDYNKNWLMVNRSGAVFRYGDQVRATRDIKASDITKFKNRTVIGGPVNGLWTKQWLAEISEMAKKSGLSEDTYSLPIAKNFIFWSSFDSVDFPFALLFPRDYVEQDLLIERFLENTWGYMEMPFKGDVLSLHSLGDSLIVLGEDGVAVLAQTEGTGATFAIQSYRSVGIKSRGAVGGDDEAMVFIDEESQLWRITSGSGINLLDFSEYIGELDGEIYITKQANEDLFYIGDKNKSFVLKGNKLSRCYQTVTSMHSGFPVRAGTSYITGSRKARIKSQDISLGQPSNKTLTGVFLDCNRVPKAKVTAEAQIRGKHVRGKQVITSPEGYAATRLFGKNHAVEVEFDSFEDLQIDRIELKWQIDDRRHTRGTVVTENATGTGE